MTFPALAGAKFPLRKNPSLFPESRVLRLVVVLPDQVANHHCCLESSLFSQDLFSGSPRLERPQEDPNATVCHPLVMNWKILSLRPIDERARGYEGTRQSLGPTGLMTSRVTTHQSTNLKSKGALCLALCFLLFLPMSPSSPSPLFPMTRPRTESPPISLDPSSPLNPCRISTPLPTCFDLHRLGRLSLHQKRPAH